MSAGYKEARGALPWEPGMLSPEDAIRKVRGRVEDMDAYDELKSENAALRAELAQLKDTLEVWRRVNEAMETVPSYLSTPDGERLLADARMKLRFVFQSPPIEGVSTQSAALDRLEALEKVAETAVERLKECVGWMAPVMDGFRIPPESDAKQILDRAMKFIAEQEPFPTLP